MKIKFEHITLVYARPKCVNTFFKVVCACGVNKQVRQEIKRYANIHICCTTCGESTIIKVNREKIVKYFMWKHTGQLASLPNFLNSWEKDMKSE